MHIEKEGFSFYDNFSETKTAIKLEIKKLNRNNQLCYYDSIDLTGKGISDEQLSIFTTLFTSAGFITNIKKYTYFGIYDPSRNAQLVEIYLTNEQLLEKEFKLYKL